MQERGRRKKAVLLSSKNIMLGPPLCKAQGTRVTGLCSGPQKPLCRLETGKEGSVEG